MALWGRKSRCRTLSHHVGSDMQRLGLCLSVCFTGTGPKAQLRNITTLSLFTLMCASVAVVITVHSYQYFIATGPHRQREIVTGSIFGSHRPPPSMNHSHVMAAGRNGLNLAAPNEEPPDMRWNDVQRQRKQQVEYICQQVRGNFEEGELPPGALRDTLIDAKEKVMFCPLLLDPLHRTTSWEAALKLSASEALRWEYDPNIPGVKYNKQSSSEVNLSQQQSAGVPTPGSKEARSVTSAPSTEWMRKHTKILFVEHPFEKLASIYLNRIRQREGFLGYEVGKKILGYSRGYRNLTRWDLEEGSIEFHEMASFILRRDTWDPHWKTIFEVCHPCDIEYDYIVKSDTLYEDIKGILRQMEPNQKRRQRQLNKFHKLDDVSDERISRTLAKQYEGISSFDMLMLYDQFSIDMFMFDYSWPFERLSVEPKT